MHRDQNLTLCTEIKASRGLNMPSEDSTLRLHYRNINSLVYQRSDTEVVCLTHGSPLLWGTPESKLKRKEDTSRYMLFDEKVTGYSPERLSRPAARLRLPVPSKPGPNLCPPRVRSTTASDDTKIAGISLKTKLVGYGFFCLTFLRVEARFLVHLASRLSIHRCTALRWATPASPPRAAG